MKKIIKYNRRFKSSEEGTVIKLYSKQELLTKLDGLTFIYKGVKVFVLKEKHCGLKFSYKLMPVSNRTKTLYRTSSKNKYIYDYTGDVKVKHLVWRAKCDIDSLLQRGLTCQFNRLWLV